ncbi:hypothetical protein BV25DRAFT_1875460 [Artomyces pyxidatus]|uniref:Uncharacterized protein n=1 Tax=Artomyces pyxidatus TaxID=48021 RepID=A0ACB8TIA5_9AGAM|nr:hypothetical protein BV25DRAFT_1875460 [Artomyces pyxidatus]
MSTARMSASVHDFLLSLPDDHPLQITLRTYSLALSLSLGPALLSFISSPKARSRGFIRGLTSIVRRELGVTAFSFAITAAVGGGSALQALWRTLDAHQADHVKLRKEGHEGQGRLRALLSRLSSLSPAQKAFISNALSSFVAIMLMQARRRSHQTRKADIPWTVPITPPSSSVMGRTSATLDLTLLLVVRAFDAMAQKVVFHRTGDETDEARKQRQRITTKLDAFAFWASSARIMWCFFYAPDRLPRSYLKWINSLANIDDDLPRALRGIRTGELSYVTGAAPQPNPAAILSQRLGHPASWGNFGLVPAYGGSAALAAWKTLGVTSRGPVGGIPCEIVHGSLGTASCSKNAGLRGIHAFFEALALYLPVHFLPILLTRPHTLLAYPTILKTLLGVVRSASFLSTFVSSIWASVCLTRTVFLARFFPGISHDFYDGPFGCIMAGCLACGSSIWIENGRRRGEMALYVLPRAIRACLPEQWLRSGGRSVYGLERLAFTFSLASLLTAAVHQPETLRGLSRWTLSFIVNGPNAALWKGRHRRTPPKAPGQNGTGMPGREPNGLQKDAEQDNVQLLQ